MSLFQIDSCGHPMLDIKDIHRVVCDLQVLLMKLNNECIDLRNENDKLKRRVLAIESKPESESF
jgi:hypothetical protein